MAQVVRNTTSLIVRHPGTGERIVPPFGLWEEDSPLSSRYDREWIWGAYDPDGVMRAILIGSPMHGFVHLVKLYAVPDGPSTAVRQVLRKAIADALERGFTGYFLVTDGSGIEGKFLRLVRRHAPRMGAVVREFTGASVAGALTKGMI